jgi:acetyltransferase-like isoleucine patch superfamily enzyme
MSSTRVSPLVALVRRAKGDDAFDLDPAIRLPDLFSFIARRTFMALRGLFLSLRTGRLVAPVFVGRGVVVTNARHLQLASGVTIGDYCRLDCLGLEGIALGRGSTLRRGVHVEVTSVLRNLGVGFTIGERAGVSEGCYIGAKGGVAIGPDTIIGPGCRLIAENHNFASLDETIRSQGVTRLGITVGQDCWLGVDVTVLDGVTIDDGCVVGAGSVVTRSIPALSVAYGVPARVVRKRGE